MVTATGLAAPQTSSPIRPAKGRFLIASRRLADPNFSETVVLLLAYEPTGAMGVVVNRPTDVRLGSVLPDVEELRDRTDPLYLGGPVAENLLLVLVRAAQPPDSSEAIFDGVYISGDRTTLRKALRKLGKRNRVRVYAGHAGWGPGQLDHEIARGDWHVTAADATMVFDMPASAIWPKLIQRFSGEWTLRETATEPHSPISSVVHSTPRRATAPMNDVQVRNSVYVSIGGSARKEVSITLREPGRHSAHAK